MRRIYAFLCRLMLIAAVLAGVAASAVIAVRYTVIAVIAAAALWYRNRGRWAGDSTHGTAHFASAAELERAGLLDRGGGRSLVLGRVGHFAGRVSKRQALRALVSPVTPSELAVLMFFAGFFRSRRLRRRLIRVHDFCHVGVVSRSGGGKGVGVVLPVCLSYTGSMFILDPKCEIFRIASKLRQGWGHTIIRLDPAGLGGAGASSFNPLAFIDPASPQFLDDCRDLANMLVVRTGLEHDPFWPTAAESVLTACIAFVVACSAKPEYKHLGTVRMLVSSPESFDEAVATMRANTNPLIADLGGQCSWFQDKVKTSVLATVQQHTNWMDSAAMATSLMTNDFNPFCVVPPEFMKTWAPWVRVVVGTTLRLIGREAVCQEKGRQGAAEQNTVAFMLDEVAQLGRFRALEDAVCIMRGMGVRLIFIMQSFEQLKTCYGENADVVLDNLGTLVVFNIGSLSTAEALVRRLGDETIRYSTPSRNSGSGTGTSSGGGSQGQSVNHSSGYGISVAQQGRKLLTADEILRLRDTALIFHNQMPPIIAERLTHFRDREFKRGRMGRQAGIGLGGGVAATIALAASVVLAIFIQRLPVASFRFPTPGGYGAGRGGFRSPWDAQVDQAWRDGIYQMFPEQEPMRYRRPLPSRLHRQTEFQELIPIE
jgi:type IV secretion system protein VirD4